MASPLCFSGVNYKEKSTSYNLLMNNLLELPQAKTVSNGVQSAMFLGCSLWLTVPNEAKNSRTIDDFKTL